MTSVPAPEPPSAEQHPAAIEIEDLSVWYRIRLDGSSLWADIKRLRARKSERADRARLEERLVHRSQRIRDRGDRSQRRRQDHAGADHRGRARTGSGTHRRPRAHEPARARSRVQPGALRTREHRARWSRVRDSPRNGWTSCRSRSPSSPSSASTSTTRSRPTRPGCGPGLGFAVAAHLDPDILLIDEALSAGDSAFAEKAAKKMAELCGHGRTIVLVTHGLGSVRAMATDAVWLHQGQVAADGRSRGDPVQVHAVLPVGEPRPPQRRDVSG